MKAALADNGAIACVRQHTNNPVKLGGVKK